MSILFAVRIFADLCLYAALAGSVGGMNQQTVALWIPAAICALAAGLGCLLRQRSVRIAALAVLPLCFLPVNTVTDLILLTPMVLYTAAMILSGRCAMSQDSYLEYYPKGLMALGLMLLISLLGLDTGQVLAYGALFAVCGIYLLRQLRLTSGSDWKDKLLNLLVLAAVIGGGLLSGYAARAVGSVLTWFFGRLQGVFYAMRNLIGESEPYEPPPPAVEEGVEVPLPDPDVPEFGPPDLPVRHDPVEIVKPILMAVLLLAAAAALFLLIRRMLRSFRARTGREQQPIRTERLQRESSGQKSFRSTNRQRIRKVYRKFLCILQKKGAVLHRSDTTADVHIQAAGYTDAEAAAALRDLYRLARYDEEAEITAEQTKNARELLRKIE